MEATGVSLDNPAGAEGMTSPLASIYQASTGPPVGGCLTVFQERMARRNLC